MEKYDITTHEGQIAANNALKYRVKYLKANPVECTNQAINLLVSELDGVDFYTQEEDADINGKIYYTINHSYETAINDYYWLYWLIDKYYCTREAEKEAKEVEEFKKSLQPNLEPEPLFIKNVKQFGKAFDMCIEMYDNIYISDNDPFSDIDDYFTSDYVYGNISSLKSAHRDFIIGFYDEIKDISDWNVQDKHFHRVKCFLSDRMFTNEFSQSKTVAKINKVTDGYLRSWGLSILLCLDEVTKWYRGTTTYHLKAFCNMNKDFILDIKLPEIEDEMKYVLSYNEMFLSGINRYCGDDYVCTDYDKKDFEKAYYLFKSHNDKLLGIIQYYNAQKEYRDIKYGMNLKYPIIKQFISNYEDITKLMQIHVFVSNDVNLIENTGKDILSKNIGTSNEQTDTILVQEKISMTPEDYAKFIANSKYQRSQYDGVADKQIEVPNVVEIPKKSMLEINILHQYLTGDKDSFNHILTHKVPKDGKKCNWIGKLTDAVIFADYLDITTTKFNECFTLLKGGELKDSNRGRKEAKDSPLYAILHPQNQ